MRRREALSTSKRLEFPDETLDIFNPASGLAQTGTAWRKATLDSVRGSKPQRALLS